MILGLNLFVFMQALVRSVLMLILPPSDTSYTKLSIMNTALCLRMLLRKQYSTLVEGSDQVETVKKILGLIGDDTPIRITNRILAAYQKVHWFVHRDKEKTFQISDRFCGLASEYMVLAVIPTMDQGSQLLGMILLQNGKLRNVVGCLMKGQLLPCVRLRKHTSIYSRIYSW